MTNRIALIAALAVAAFAPVAGAQTITAVYTTYSDTGVPTKLDITGTAFCSTTPCGTKAPVVRLAGNIVAISGSSPTGIGVPLTGVFADGDYMLTVTPYSKSAITYAFTLKSKTGGATGLQGPAGPMGPQGPQGSTGLQGPKGDAGAQGLQGPPGVAGADGAQGPMGLQGLKGDKGDKGDTGATGPQGPAGQLPAGTVVGSVLYWNGSSWTSVDTPAEADDIGLRLCAGKPMWVRSCPVAGGTQIPLSPAAVIGNKGSYTVSCCFPVGAIFDNQYGPISSESYSAGYWLNSDNAPKDAFITIDLGQPYVISRVELFNTSNGSNGDRGTGAFDIIGSNEVVNVGSYGATVSGTFGTLVTGSMAPATPSAAREAQRFTSTDLGSYRYLQFRPKSVAALNPITSTSYGLNELRVFGNSPKGSEPLPSTFMVSALTGPWLESANPSLIYASNLGVVPKPPVEIDLAARSFAEGDAIEVVCLGGSLDLGGAPYVGDCRGLVNLGPNYQALWPDHHFPALYFPNIGDSYVGQMMATFVDASGTVVGQPYLVGQTAAQITVPAGAKKLLLGLNETNYANNDGSTFLWGSVRKVTLP